MLQEVRRRRSLRMPSRRRVPGWANILGGGTEWSVSRNERDLGATYSQRVSHCGGVALSPDPLAKFFAFPHVTAFDNLQPFPDLRGGVIELIGSPLLLIGLFTRPVAFVLSGEMAVAYFMVRPARLLPAAQWWRGGSVLLLCLPLSGVCRRGSVEHRPAMAPYRPNVAR